MIRKKHLRPELREQYDHWEHEFMTMHRKKYTTLFFIWLAIWLVGAACVLFLEPNIWISFCFMLWAIAGLTGTLIFNHHCVKYVEAHVYDKPADDPQQEPENAESAPEETSPAAEDESKPE